MCCMCCVWTWRESGVGRASCLVEGKGGGDGGGVGQGSYMMNSRGGNAMEVQLQSLLLLLLETYPFITLFRTVQFKFISYTYSVV